MDILKCSEAIDNLHSIAVKCDSRIINEENTKAALILPFLNMLGYQLIVDIEPEYSICSGRVDYYIENKEFNRKSILIECKRLNTNIDDEQNIVQIERYSRELEPTISILTNGKIYRFYRLENRQLKLIFTFNIFNYSVRELRNLLNLSKNNIKNIEENIELFNNDIDKLYRQYQESKGRDLRDEIQTRVLEDLEICINTSKLYSGIEIVSKINKLLGKETLDINITIPSTIKEASNISVYDVLAKMNIHDKIIFKSDIFRFNIEYDGSLCNIYKGSKISSKCTYRGNKLLEDKLEDKIRNFTLTEDIKGILLFDAINIVFGVTNGRVPNELDNIIRKDIYNNLEDKYIFQSIGLIVALEKNILAFMDTLKQFEEKEDLVGLKR